MDRPWQLLRWAGVGASATMAASAYLAGALPGGDPGPDLRLLGLGAMSRGFQAGMLLFTVALTGWLLVWGRLVAALGRRTDTPGARWMATTGALWALPLLLAPPLGSRDVYSYACQGWLQAIGDDPYTTSPATGDCPWVGAVAPLWHTTTAPYGPLGLALAALGAGPAAATPLPAHLRLLLAIGLLRAVAVAGAGLAGWGVARLAARSGAPAGHAMALAVVNPLVAIHVVSGAHNDAVLAGLVVTGLLLAAARPDGGRWAAGRLPTTAIAAGAAIGLAASIKVTASVAWPFAMLLAAAPTRGPARSRPALAPAAAVAGGAAAAYLGIMAATGRGFGWVHALDATAASVQWTSPPTAVGMAGGYLLRITGHPAGVATAVAVARGVGLVVLAGALVGLARLAWRRRGEPGTVTACCGAGLAATVLLAPVCYPWYALGPLALLAATLPAGTARRWLLPVVVVLAALEFPNGLNVAVVTKVPGTLGVVGCLAALSVAAARRWRSHSTGRGLPPAAPVAGRPSGSGAPAGPTPNVTSCTPAA